MSAAKLFEGLGAIVSSRFMYPSVLDLTAAQIATLNTVPVDLIQSPGAGLVICPIGAAWQYKPGNVAFTSAVTLRLIWSDGTLLASVASVGLNTTTAKQGTFAPLGPAGGGVGGGSNLFLTASADPSGLGDGTLRIIVAYQILPMK